MIIDFLKKHKERRIDEICERINLDWDGEQNNPAWDRAVKSYAESIYKDRMERRRDR